MKALVVAGGVPQVELLNQLKERGITTVLADGSPNAVSRPYADIFYNVNIFDIQAIKVDPRIKYYSSFVLCKGRFFCTLLYIKIHLREV